ncbi:MAG: DNA polymerase Y family protein [bacterium]|nr:DNA polymerase Y family protein [bacterium]
MRLYALDSDALSLGLMPAMSLADARAQIPELRVFDADPHADQDWLERLCDGAARYTPMVAVDPPDGLMLDIGGCAHLFGGEAALMQEAVTRLQARGIRVRTALGDTAEAAHALARFAGPPAPDEAAAIRRLPVAALRLDPDSETALRRAGLKTVGDVAARPAATLAARFGAEAVDALHRLLGQAARPLSPRPVLPAIQIERHFAEPVARTDYVMTALESLVTQACTQLGERAQGGRRFHAIFFRSDGLAFPLRVETSLPVRESEAIMRLFGERIDSLSDPIDPGFGFDMVRLAVPRTEPLAASQFALEGGQVREDSNVAALIDALTTRAGRNRILRLTSVDSHIPEQAQLALPAVENRSPAAWVTEPDPFTSSDPPIRPIHLFDPPQRIDVMAQVPDGPPHRFRWRRTLHEVTRYEGPERIAPEWWKIPDGQLKAPGQDRFLTRDYYRVEDIRGRRFWIFRHGLYNEARADPHPRWYMHGLFA